MGFQRLFRATVLLAIGHGAVGKMPGGVDRQNIEDEYDFIICGGMISLPQNRVKTSNVLKAGPPDLSSRID